MSVDPWDLKNGFKLEQEFLYQKLLKKWKEWKRRLQESIEHGQKGSDPTGYDSQYCRSRKPRTEIVRFVAKHFDIPFEEFMKKAKADLPDPKSWQKLRAPETPETPDTDEEGE